MTPEVALIICIIFILFLFLMDRRNADGVSGATWIPLIWILLTGSRSLSSWLGLHSAGLSVDVDQEGSTVDRIAFMILIFAGAFVLKRRKIDWHELFRQNRWLCLFFIFGALSIFWSNYPYVSFKRWFKALGNVIMVLVVLTEQRPYEAVGVILRRFAFLFLPLSVIFIKYYPDLGRMYTYAGGAMFVGVSDQKNGLGQICLVSGIYFIWTMLFDRQARHEYGRMRYFLYFAMLSMIIWLFGKADSATSLVCMVVATAIYMVGRLPSVKRDPRKALIVGISGIALFVALELLIQYSSTVISMLGRRTDLTTRVPMWKDLLATVKNPILGYGFESYWLGDRRLVMLDRWGIGGQAHNGYLQTYLDLGLIGLLILIGWIFSGMRKSVNQLSVDYSTAILRFCLLIVIVIYNWTEASFYGASLMWSLFIFSGMDVPEYHPRLEPVHEESETWGAMNDPDGEYQ
jgi:O-antigen ligase